MRTLCLVLLATVALAASQSAPNLTFKGPGRPLHAQVSAGPDGLDVKPGAKTMLFVDIAPNANIHVYAPGAKDYITVTVKIQPQANVKVGKLMFPKSEIVTLLDEKVPVYQKPFRLTQELTVLGSLKTGAAVPVSGTVEYQACDDKVCYAPESAPVSWTLNVK
jgi:hypothetical protein